MNCRQCGGGTERVLTLGSQRLADFRTDDQKPPQYPLNLEFCPGCGLVQLDTTVNRELMYHSRYGFKSGVNESIRADLQSVVSSTLKRIKPKSWLDIACNDGSLLSYVPEDVYRSGIDPVWKYRKEAQKHANVIVSDFFHPLWFEQEFDVVSSVSMFYDINDPNAFVEGVKHVLAEDGVWVVQQNYLVDTLLQNAVDNVCHEHITYYSLVTFQKLMDAHGLEVFDVEFSKVNGGCIRTFVARKGKRRVEEAVIEQIQWELLNIDVLDPNTYRAWGVRARNALVRLYEHVSKAEGDVAIYGASTRGGTIWQAAGLTKKNFVYAVDRNPEKVGKVMSSIGVPIVSEARARADRPSQMVVSLWFFKQQVIEREKEYLEAGGKLVFPLPKFEVVG